MLSSGIREARIRPSRDGSSAFWKCSTSEVSLSDLYSYGGVERENSGSAFEAARSRLLTCLSHFRRQLVPDMEWPSKRAKKTVEHIGLIMEYYLDNGQQ